MRKALEKKWRNFRDEKIIKPLVRSSFFQKHYSSDYDAAVIDFGDHRLAFDPSDRVIGSAIRRTGGWNRDETLAIFDAMPKAGSVFVDVGANIGTQTVYALKFGGFERAICFEPVPKNVLLLRTNLAINGLSERAIVIEAAAGATNGKATISLDPLNSGGHSIAQERGGGSLVVNQVSVQGALDRAGVAKADIRLVWIDTEGFEAEVLAGWPSLPGTPTCMEYWANKRRLPLSAFSGWKRWAMLGPAIEWRPISEFDFAGQADVLLT